ncbi:hypothetical protein E2320_013009 [Naja naja]|nr:hypothetical protein E2320_013009 [Naja naja]
MREFRGRHVPLEVLTSSFVVWFKATRNVWNPVRPTTDQRVKKQIKTSRTMPVQTFWPNSLPRLQALLTQGDVDNVEGEDVDGEE